MKLSEFFFNTLDRYQVYFKNKAAEIFKHDEKETYYMTQFNIIAEELQIWVYFLIEHFKNTDYKQFIISLSIDILAMNFEAAKIKSKALDDFDTDSQSLIICIFNNRPPNIYLKFLHHIIHESNPYIHKILNYMNCDIRTNPIVVVDRLKYLLLKIDNKSKSLKIMIETLDEAIY